MLLIFPRFRPLVVGGMLAALALMLTIGIAPRRAEAAFAQRVRAGNTHSYVDGSGNVWAADRAYSAGGFGYSTGDAYATSAPIAGTTEGALFQANRHATAFSYRFDVPNGNYQVLLR